MEEFIQHIVNETKHVPTTGERVYDGVKTTFCLIGLAFNILILFIFIKTKQIQTRTNLFILNFVITDALNVATNPSMLVPILTSGLNEERADLFYCIVDELDDLYQLGSYIFIAMLISNAVIKTGISNATLISSVYFALILIFLSNIGLCLQSSIYFYAFPIFLISFIIVTCVIVVMLGKELNRFFKRRRNEQLNQSTTFRFNLARIYVYNSFICDFLLLISYPRFNILTFLSLSVHLNSLFITIYLAYVDIKFNLYVISLLTCKWRECDLDSAISFADDCSEEENVDMDFVVNARNVEIVTENGVHV